MSKRIRFLAIFNTEVINIAQGVEILDVLPCHSGW